VEDVHLAADVGGGDGSFSSANSANWALASAYWGDLGPDFFGGLVGGQPVQRVVLGLGDHRLHRLKVRDRCEEPGDDESVAIDVEPGQVGVADVVQQRGTGCLGGLLQGRRDLVQRVLVADLHDAERLVHAEPVASRVLQGLVVRHDLQQVIGVPAVRCHQDAAPVLVMRIVRSRSSLALLIFSRCRPAWVCSANLSIAALTAD
jgi:hypothetical protein